jgi:DnaK suppressor protein
MDVTHAKELLTEELERLQQLEDQIEESGELDVSQQDSSGALTSHDQHVGDAGTQTFQRERDVSIEERLESKRNEVSYALERIENDDYGDCEVCGREISDERLLALPATRYCAEHASELEEETLSTARGWSITQDLDLD